MKIDIEQTTVTGPAAIKLSHGGRSMIWDTSAYSKSSDHKSPMNPHLIFKEINAFWETLPLKSQVKFWDLYSEAREAFDSVFDVRTLQATLQDIVRRIYDIPELDGVAHWVKYRSGIRFPADLKDTFEEVQAVNPVRVADKEKTYLKGEYIALAVDTVKLRIMVPIWSEFIRVARSEVGGNSKELEAFRLLYHSKMHQSEAMHRLFRYAQVTVRTLMGTELPATAILNGMGENEIVDWMLTTCVVRRVAMCPISVTDDVSNIITNIHQYIRMGVQGASKKHGKKFGGRVNLRPPSEMGEGKDKRSVAEVNKVKQGIPDGMRAFLNVYTENPFNVLQRALLLTQKGSFDLVAPMPDYLPSRFELCLKTVNKVPNFSIEPHQLALAQFTLGHVLSAKGMPLLNYANLLNMLAVSQCVLWEWGFYDLAALITAQKFEVGDDAMIGATETRGRIPKDALDELAQRWPHSQPSKGKQSFRTNNVAARTIDSLSDLLTESDWELYCPKELGALVARSTRGRRMIVPSDIRHTLSFLLLKVDENLKEVTKEEV